MLNLGILELLQNARFRNEIERIRETAAVHKLLAEHEMGELFKVLCAGRGLIGVATPSGLAAGNRVHRL